VRRTLEGIRGGVMTFDTNNTGKYIFDDRQSLTTDEYIALEKEYYARLKSNPSSAYKNMSFTNVADTANQVVTYIIIGLAVILPLLSWLLFFKDLTGYFKLFATIGVTLTGIGIMLFVKLVLRLTVRQRVYSEAVDAECIGYARYFESDSGENAFPDSGTPMVSPVFTYRYGGVVYTGCYDGFEISKDCSVALGPVKINISPEHPEAIYNQRAQQKDLFILFAVTFVVIGVILTVLGNSF
jgi:hypothetical protein